MINGAVPNAVLADFLPTGNFCNWSRTAQIIPQSVLNADSSAKLHVLSLCLRYGSLPQFTSTQLGNSVEVSISWPENDISVTARRHTLVNAERAACVAFKLMAQQHFRDKLNTTIYLNDLSELSPANAEQFVTYMAELDGQEVKYLDKNSKKFFGGEVYIGDTLAGQVRGMHSRADAKIAAYLISAFVIKQREEDLWKKFVTELRTGHGIVLKKLAPIYTRWDAGVIGCIRATSKDMMNLLRKLAPDDDVQQQLEKELKEYAPFSRRLLSESEIELKSQELRAQYDQYRTSEATAAMREIRSQLPVNQYADEVLEMINNNDVCVVVGATGSGKSTQVPQIVLDDYIKRGEGAKCNVIVTQPRRIAASSVADRVANERHDRLGQGVGFQVRFESRLAKQGGSINFMTTGVLLRQMQTDIESAFAGLTHVIVDEVHERSIMIDFLLVLIKRRLELKRQGYEIHMPKIILMSATVDTNLFSRYFKDSENNCPSISIPGRTFPVEMNYLEDIMKYIDSKSILTKSSDRQLQKFIAKEMELELKPEIVDSEDESPGVDWQTKGVFGDSGVVATFQDESYVPHELISSLIGNIVTKEPEGSILVFLPGIADIVSVEKLLKAENNQIFSDPDKARLYILHSTIQNAQKTVFEKVPDGCRKIILSTNIAETSVTIPELRYVIDSGKEREKKFLTTQRITTLLIDWVSQSNIKQRSGRAGRVSNGVYYGLFSKKRVNHLNTNPTPEILRSDLQQICLETKALGIKDSVENFLKDTIQPPSGIAVSYAMDTLKHIHALTSDGELTPEGKLYSTL